MTIGQIAATVQPSDPLVSEIERASTQHARMFWLSVAVIVLGAIATAIVTYFVWRSGNRVQDAIRAEGNTKIAEANLRIAEANLEIVTARAAAAEATRRAAEAGEGTARALKEGAAINERATRLELEVAQQQGAVAEQRERAAKADERAARAERDLVELKQRTEPRRLSPDQRAAITAALQRVPRQSILVTTVSNDEARGFADDIVRLLRALGWTVQPLLHGQILPTPYGLKYFTGRTQEINAATRALLEAMKAAGIDIAVVPGGDPGIEVGLKPVAR